MHLRGVLSQIPQAAPQFLAVIEAGADNDLGIDADVVRGQLGDILEHLAAAGVFHQFDPQLRVGGVDRDIDGADVHFDDAGDVLIGHIGEGDIAAEQEAHAAVVILKVEGFAHALGQLIDEAENALIGAVVLAIHEVIGKFQPQLVVLLFFDVKGERLAVPFHFDGEGSIDHIKAVIQHIVDEIAVDGDQAVAGPDAGFGGGSMRGDAIDENGHVFFSKASEIGGAADKNGKMTRRGPQAGLCPVKAG